MAAALPAATAVAAYEPLFFKQSIVKELDEALGRPFGICLDIIEIMTQFLETQKPFGANEWKNYFGLDAGSEPAFTPEFYRFWHGPDPLDQTKRVSQTHLMPVLAPQAWKQSKKNLPRTLSIFEGMGFNFGAKYLKALRNLPGGPTCWLVMRQDVLARNQIFDHQKLLLRQVNQRTQAGYEEVPSIVDLVTVVFAYQRFNGQRHLGDATGAEGQITYSRCKEQPLLVLGHFIPGLSIYILSQGANTTQPSIGIAAIRKF